MKKITKGERLIEGFLTISGKKGYVRPTEEYEQEFPEICVSADRLGRAFDGDKVAVAVFVPVLRGMQPEGRIEKIIEEGPRLYSGIIRNKGGKNVFINDGKKRKIFTEAEIAGDTKNAQDNFSVTFYLDKYNVSRDYYSGHIVKVFGNSKDAGVDITTILAGYGIEAEFPEEALAELEDIPDKLSPQSVAAKIRKGRMDFRELQTVTMDAEDTKDVDDAVSVSKNKDGSYVLGVHIADVSEYVKEGSKLDEEAYKRGTSVYPVDRVVPMLPPKLSNGICSLNVGVDRLALSVMMTFDDKGNMLKNSMYESVIRVTDKITYKQMYRLLEEKDDELEKKYAGMLEMFENMRVLSSILRKKRNREGGLDFDFPEIKVEIDNDGKPVSIGKYEKTFANDMIEDFMVAANETVAEFFCTKKIPFLYRIHEEPEKRKIEQLARTIKSADGTADIPKGKIRPIDVAKMLDSIKGKPSENVIQFLALHSMQRAEYSAENKGHFGLAADYYSHFTSPIRRYPDLFIHRIIKKYLRGELNPTAKKHFEEIKYDVAENCSITERRAAEAELSVRDYKVVQYMSRFVGETFEGEISNITGFGFYVRLDNMAEGLVHFNTVSDFIEFDEIRMIARGKRTGITFLPGMRVKIKVLKAEPETRQLDFALATDKGPGSGKKFAKQGKKAVIKTAQRGGAKGRRGMSPKQYGMKLKRKKGKR